MKDFFKNFLGKLKKPTKESTSKMAKGLAGKLKHLSDTAKAKGRLKKLSGPGINFNWDEFIGTIFSPESRPYIHKTFIAVLTASTAYVGGKAIVSFIPEEDIVKKSCGYTSGFLKKELKK